MFSKEKKFEFSGLILFIVALLLTSSFIFLVREENHATNPLDGLFSAPLFGGEKENEFSYYETNSIKQSTINDVNNIEVYFCPQDYCSEKLIKKIDSAHSTIFVAIYSFTHDEIGEALIRAKKRGVDVRVVYDFGQSKNAASDDKLLISEGIKVAYRSGSGYMHNKYTVIDSDLVATGSFNYSMNADTRNEENLVFIQSKDLANYFEENFLEIWGKSNPN